MGLENDEPTGNIEGIDADKLLSDIESGGNTEIPMHAANEPAAAEPTPTVSEFVFDHSGKQIKIPLTDPKLKQWTQQGYDYAQRMAAFNNERTQWESQKSEFEKSFSPYKTIDEYAKQNPEWWNHVEATWKSRDQSSPDASNAEVPAWVKEKLEKAEQFISKVETKEAEQQRAADDTKLDQEVQSIREQFKDLDWNTPDEKGLSLEKRVLDHAIQNGIQSFRAAFRDYNHENLLKLAEERGKTQINKEFQKRTKLGLLGQTPTPQKGIQPPKNLKSQSYEDILNEAKEELGIA